MKIKMAKIRQLMGRLVVVTRQVRSRSHVIAETITPRTGWVVGVRWLRDGRRVYEGTEVGYVFRGTGPAMPHLLVSFWPSQNAVRVPWDGWRLARVDGKDPAPWDGQWSEMERDKQRRIMADEPRDKRGKLR